MQTQMPEMGLFDMPFYLYLFDEGDSTETEGLEGESQAAATVIEKPAAKVVSKAVSSIKKPSESEESYELRVRLEEAQAAAQSAKDRITELNAENLRRRKAAETLELRLNTADKRVIRAEAVEALQEQGVINKRIVDLFLADLGEKAKIDPNTGDAIGIRENLADWKESNKDFFKVLETKETTTETVAETKTEEQQKKNATATGASTSGAAAGKTATNGLPDLRTLTPKERKDALAAYGKSQRGSR